MKIAVKKLLDKYPLTQIDNFDDQTWVTGFDYNTAIACTMYCAPIMDHFLIRVFSRNEIYVNDVNLFGWDKIERRDANGNVVWYLNVDRSQFDEAMVYARVSGLNEEQIIKYFQFPIQTNMTLAQWNEARKKEVLLGLNFFAQLIEAQIKADAQIQEAVKQWWNEPPKQEVVIPKVIIPAPTCTTFFNTTDTNIPAGYKPPFQKLAARKGNTGAVDSCDMTAFYDELGTSPKQRFTSPQSYMKEEFWWSELGYVNVFNYETFYGHLAQSVRNKFFPRVVDTQKKLRESGEDISALTKTPTQLYNGFDKGVRSTGLWGAINQFTQTHPFVVPYYALIGYEPQVYMTGSDFSVDNIVSGAGYLVLQEKDEIYTMERPFVSGQPFSELQVRRYDSAGNITWYLNVDRSALASAIPDAKLTGRSLGTALKSYETPVETNMTSSQWSHLKSQGSGNIGFLAGLEELFPDDTAVDALIQQRISAQITADAQMYDWTRDLKQWWNGP